ncbi:MAG: hypothetical protein Q7U37_04095 [Gallionella sp.]|nr:hypothetical protein [Gallionella sp.]
MRFDFLPVMLLAGAFATLATSAQAEVNLNAGVRLSQNDNINGSPDTPTTANQLRDSYSTLNACAVYFTPLNDKQTRYFIGQLGAMTSTYNVYNNLDSSALMTSAGLYQKLSNTWSAQLMGRGFSRYTKQTARDSSGYGATFELKDQLTETVWVKGVLDYESSKANLSSYSNTGNAWGLNLGYLPLKDTFLNFGYSHSNHDFKTVAPFRTATQMLFIEASQRLSKNWYLNGGYASMKNDSNYAGTAYTNRVLSIGLSCSY